MALYRRGLRRSAPFHVVHLAGFDFPKVTEKVTGSGPDTKRTEIRGVTAELDDEQLKAIAAAAERKVIRMTQGKSPRPLLLSKDGRGFVPMERDEPLMDYVYVEPVEHDPQQAPDPEGINLGELLAPAKAKAAAKK